MPAAIEPDLLAIPNEQTSQTETYPQILHPSCVDTQQFSETAYTLPTNVPLDANFLLFLVWKQFQIHKCMAD
jgi:hypothetical protein